MTHYEELVAIIEADEWPTDPDECVEWQHGKDRGGYGRLTIDRRWRLVHRVSYCLSRWMDLDTIPDLQVNHRCISSRACLRPSHLYLGTQKDNMRDRVNDGRDINANKTHCPQGHSYSAANTYVWQSGGRHCRSCHRAAMQAVRDAWTPEQKAANAVYMKEYSANMTQGQKVARNAKARAKYHADKKKEN